MLPQKLPLPLMQTQWAAQINPLLENPLNGVQILEGIALNNGHPTIINHKLGRVMQGWFILDINNAATIYRPSTAPFNDKTLTLLSNASATVNIGVF